MVPFPVIVILVVVSTVLALAVLGVALRLRKAAAERNELRERYRPVVDAEAERDRILTKIGDEREAHETAMRRDRSLADQELAMVREEVAAGKSESQRLRDAIAALHADFAKLDEEATIQSFGFYKPHYTFSESQKYADELDRIRAAQRKMLQDRTAATCAIEWQVNGSKAEGRKQTNQTLRLMLRAFNGESDAAIAKVNYRNVHVMEARIRKAHELINGLAAVQQATIAEEYLDLKLKELFLAHEYEEKIQDEKEEQRRVREQMREEEIAQRELERARAEAEKDEAKYEQLLARARDEAARAEGARQEKMLAQITELQKRLEEAHTNKERAIARAQMTRSGHVYVISNVGAFGEHVFKIGMTRRLDPMDRVRELSDASVPFSFDVHAIIFSEDAPTLESALHRQFTRRRINRVNEKKESASRSTRLLRWSVSSTATSSSHWPQKPRSTARRSR